MNTHAALLVFAMAVVTMLLRFLPFLLFRNQTPRYISYLGEVLPAAIIGMLVVYCLKDTVLTEPPFCVPELLAGLAVAGLQIWKRNSLLSILGGTVFYMVLVQTVFPFF